MKIGEVEYPEVRGGVSKDDVTTMAAERAIEVLTVGGERGRGSIRRWTREVLDGIGSEIRIVPSEILRRTTADLLYSFL